MGEHAFEAHVGRVGEGAREGGDFFGQHAEAIHSGIHF